MDVEPDIRIEVRSDPRLLGSVRGLVRGWVHAFDVDTEIADEVVLAIDEACSNAIRHSYGGRSDATVELTLRATAAYLEFEVSDRGSPCPPECFERRTLQRPTPAEVRPGGLGVQLMHQIFDEVEFSCGDDSGNRVVLRLRRNR